MDTENKTPAPAEPEKPKKPELVEETPIQTQHEIFIDGKTLKYTVTTGMMSIRNAENREIEANMFFMAYTLDDPKRDSSRPLTFSFNGGPGSALIWLHLGALGQKRVKMQDEGWMPAPPYQLVDNPHTWLDQTDLVFIDPVGIGFSRAANADLNKKFWSVKGDIESVGEFIRLYLTQYERWASPLFLSGESYGTTRAAGLAGHLIDKGIALNGIIFVSTTLNFQSLIFTRGNDLPHTVYIPTYASTAWYHKRLAADLQAKSLAEVVAEVEAWTENDYTVALAKGDRLSARERTAIAKRLARYTGLSQRYIEDSHLRIDIMRFCKELLRDQKRSVGRLDSRFKGMDANPVSEFFDFDPSLTAITPPYTSTFNDYVRRSLGYKTDLVYHTLSFEVNRGWDRETGNGFTDTSEALRSAFAKNPFMKVMVAQGYYDLATPHFAALYTFAHMDLDPSVREHVSVTYYEAGHMFYLDVNSLAKFRADVGNFFKSVLQVIQTG